MTREKDDPEKRNLLTEQKDDKKRRQYSGSRTKLDRRSCDSSCSDHRKRGNNFKTPSSDQRNAEYKQNRPSNMPYQSEKKDSWWFWQKDKDSKKQQNEDTCSCVSCALKRIISSEYACVGCLLLIFTISIIVAFLVVCKSVPTFGTPEPKPVPCKPCKPPPKEPPPCKEPPCKEPPPCKDPPCKCKPCKPFPLDSERLKRKIEMLSDKNAQYDLTGLDQFGYKNYKAGYEDDGVGHLAGASGVGPTRGAGTYTEEQTRRKEEQKRRKEKQACQQEEQNSLDESESKLSAEVDFSNVLEGEKMNEIQSSEKLKDFYKKLVQTDAKIKYLKQLNQDNYLETDENPQKSPDRSKRSLKLYYPNSYRYQAIRRNRRSVRQKDRKFNDPHLRKRQGTNATRLFQGIRTRQQNNTRSREQRKEADDNLQYAERQFKKRQGQNATKIVKTKLSDSPLKKRQQNQTRAYSKPKEDQPTGFVIEKKKLIVQYKPATNLKKLPVKKCSHAPKDLHVVQENQLKHPFYKNTQRLDELLDRFLNKNLPEIMSDPFGLDMLFKHEKSQKCKHPKPVMNAEPLVDQIPKPKSKQKKPKEEPAEENQTEAKKYMRPETSTQYEKQFFIHEEQLIGQEKQKIVTASPNDFEVLLSVSTIMNPDIKKTGKLPGNNAPNSRRLMQLDGEDDENLGYEDFKEVLTDDVENHDDMDKSRDKKKRDAPPPPPKPLPPEKVFKNNPPGVHNPNWKGPMPLYPDELNSMIQHAALNANKTYLQVDLPSSTNDLQELFLYRKSRDLSDEEYVEDYLNNKYDKLVEMAQAYSDYGVLDGKKDSRNEKNSASDITATEHRVKLSPTNSNFMKKLQKGRNPSVVTESSAAGRSLRQLSSPGNKEVTTEQTGGGSRNTQLYHTPTSTKEGIRFELRPTTKAREDEDLHPLRVLSKHFKLERVLNVTNVTTALPKKQPPIHSTLISTYPDMELIYSKNPNAMNNMKKVNPNLKLQKINPKVTQKDKTVIFSLKRNLLSTDSKSSSTVSEADEIVEEISRNDETMHDAQKNRNFNNQKYNKPKQQALSRYLEKMMQKNIKIYSSASVNANLRNFTSSIKVSAPTITTKVTTTTEGSEVDKLHLPPITPLHYPPTRDYSTATPASKKHHLPVSIIRSHPPEVETLTNMEFLKVDPEQEHHRRIANILMPSTVLSISPYNSIYFANPSIERVPVTLLGETKVSIDKSEISLDENIGNNCAGKIVLTVEDPEIGTESIDINFDIPLVISFNDDFADIPMNETYSFRNNLSELDFSTELFFDPSSNDTELPTETGIDPNDQTKRKRTKRSLSSLFEPKDVDEILKSYTYEGPLEGSPNITSSSTISSSISSTMTVKKSTNTPVLNGTEEMSLSDFLMMVSDWFKALEGAKSQNRDPGQDLADLISKISNESESTTTHRTVTSTTTPRTTTADLFPNYDSDMIENIGHRSRVLLAIEPDSITNETTTVGYYNETSTEASVMANSTDLMLKSSAKQVGNVLKKKPSPSSTKRTHKVTKPSPSVKATKKKTVKKTKKKLKSKKKVKKKKPKPKQVFKRNADDSNLIFWNDIYDDEYGIQSDSLDNTLRNKHSAEDNDFIKRSGRWVHDKIRKFAENLKFNPRQGGVAIKERVPRSVKTQYVVKETGAGNYPKYVYEQPAQKNDRLHRREPPSGELEEEDYDAEQKSVFTALSANMKEVCKKAARAVQQTRNIEVREDSHQGNIATSLMQQLVRLLTDLIDYQVQQKTCTKLPPDLQTFLEWLTQPRENLADGAADSLTYRPFQEEDLIEELELATADEKTTERPETSAQQPAKPPQGQVADARLHYLDCLRSVQELIETYEDLTDDDKSKMTGVKTYLENQMGYLNKFLASYDLFSILEKNNKMRMKRDIKPKRLIPQKRRKRRKVGKFIRNFGRKHTRTTASFYDVSMLQGTERRKKTVSYEIIDAKLEEKKGNSEVKRNLKDVYYKAVAEAKKYATAKVSTEGSFGTTIEVAMRNT